MKEYSARFCTLVAKLRDWPENLKVDCFRNGLNPDIMSKVLYQANHPTLVGWNQLAAEVKSQQCLVKSIRQTQYTPPGKKLESKPRSSSRESTQEQHFPQEQCLKCGSNGHFATQCPSQDTPLTATTVTKVLLCQTPHMTGVAKQCPKSSKSALADFLEDPESLTLALEDIGTTIEPQPLGNV